MISLPLDPPIILAASSFYPITPPPGEIYLWLALSSLWFTATLISYGALLIALKTRFSRRTPAKRNRRLPKILRVSYHQGLLALVGVALYIAAYFYRFTIHLPNWNPDHLKNVGNCLAKCNTVAGVCAAAAALSLVATWTWIRRLQRTADGLRHKRRKAGRTHKWEASVHTSAN